MVPASDRRVIGSVITTGWRAVVRAVLPTLDDLAAQVTAALDDLTRADAEIRALRRALDDLGHHVETMEDLSARVRRIEDLALGDRLARIEARLGATAARHPGLTEAPEAIDAGTAAMAVERARIEIPEQGRLRAYLAALPETGRVLDLSWDPAMAPQLAGAGLIVRSVALDPASAEQRTAQGVTAEVGDPLEALGQCAKASLEGITAVGLGDHLTASQWRALAPMAFNALRDGGGLVLEMFNSTTPAALALRSRDPGLPPPTHPETVAFLLRAAGFADVEVRFLGAFPDDQAVPITPDPDWFDQRLNAMAATINRLVVGQPLVAILARR